MTNASIKANMRGMGHEETKKGVLPPLRPRTKVDGDGVLLVLDNGVRIESKAVSPKRLSGSYMLVVDVDGNEIGYWNAEEWGKDPEAVMNAILVCVVTGKPVEDRDELEEFPSPEAQDLRDGVPTEPKVAISKLMKLLAEVHPEHPQPEICSACEVLGRVKKPHDKYAGKPDHEAVGWQPPK